VLNAVAKLKALLRDRAAAMLGVSAQENCDGKGAIGVETASLAMFIAGSSRSRGVG
jgi:hypothetical protein